jgi:hypothetical protein
MVKPVSILDTNDPSYIEVRAKHFVFFEGEESGIGVNRREDQPNLELRPCEKPGLHPGEQLFYIQGEGVDAWCRTLRLPPLHELASSRCSFIAKKQQYHRPGSPLAGACLVYDNKEGRIFYNHFIRDHNGGRERMGFNAEHKKLRGYFLEHADTILRNGTNYPAHEVKFEQSIAAPAAYTLFQAYRFSKEEKYLTGAKKQLEVLSLFNGRQPDSCLYETAIRHWDGYWFGKRRLCGDTFPHYWSALTGLVYAEYRKAGGGEENRILAEHSIRGTLGLILPDGSASCAHLYPHSVNGIPGNFFDPWANDQDWALYLALRFFYDLELVPKLG